MAPRPGKPGSMLLLLAVYAAALGVATLALLGLRGIHPLWQVLLADVAATCVVFGASLWLDNSSVYDPYWSIAPLPIALHLAWFTDAGEGGQGPRQLLVMALVALWGARLTYNFLTGWSGLNHEDWRYDDFRRKTGRWYWVVSFFGIHLFPTFQVLLGCLALWPALTGSSPLGVLDALAFTVTGGAILIEALADRQLRAFVSGPKRPGAILEQGLWAWSRHPNYLGEVCFWWGLFLFALAADPSAWWSGAGALAISLMFRLVSIPMLEKRMLERRPAYAEVQQRVSMLLPWPRRSVR